MSHGISDGLGSRFFRPTKQLLVIKLSEKDTKASFKWYEYWFVSGMATGSCNQFVMSSDNFYLKIKEILEVYIYYYAV